MSRKTAVLSAIVVFALAIAVAAGVTGTSAADSSGNQLAGAWQATVIPPAPQPPVHSLQVYNGDGGWVETSNQDPATRSAMYGAWERIGRRLYAATGVHYLFNRQTGAYLGTRKINRTIELARDGQSFSIIARVTTLDPDGNVLGSFVATSSGERMQVERIPEQP